MNEPKLASNKVLWIFAIGQLGWAMMSGIINNWLVYFYQPGESLLAQGHTIFITQGAVVLGLTVIGVISALGRVFDAFTDPFIGSLSDRCKHPMGRRTPFLRYAAIPLGVFTVLVFCSPFGSEGANNIFLGAMILCFYLSLTCYCTPYNALIPELGRDQRTRVNVSTFISFTYFIGTAFAYLITNVSAFFEPALGVTNAFRITVGFFAVIAIVCMLIPSFAIDEHTYAVTQPSTSGMGASLKKTFKNKQFRTFVGSDVLYWIALTMFQTGLPFYITELMGLDDGMTFVLFAIMTVISVCFYAPVNIVAKRIGKKKLVVFAFIWFAVTFAITTVVGLFGVPGMAWGIIVAILAAIPMAILGILPQAVVADIAQADGIETGENRQGMFYAARTFAFKLGQAVSMAAFTSIALIGTGGFGYRLTALVAAVFCLCGGVVFMRYNEQKTMEIIENGTAKAIPEPGIPPEFEPAPASEFEPIAEDAAAAAAAVTPEVAPEPEPAFEPAAEPAAEPVADFASAEGPAFDTEDAPAPETDNADQEA